MILHLSIVLCLFVLLCSGKSTLTDSLIAAAGIIAKATAGNTRFMDTRYRTTLVPRAFIELPPSCVRFLVGDFSSALTLPYALSYAVT